MARFLLETENMRFWILFGLVGWALTNYLGESKRLGLSGDTSPTIYYDAARHSLVVGPVVRAGDVVEVLNVIGQRVATFTLPESSEEPGRLLTLPLPNLSPGLYYARWLQNDQIYQVKRFSVT